MLKKTIKYRDLDGKEVTEDFFFHLSKAEIIEMELSREGGLAKHLQDVIASENGAEIVKVFKNLVLQAYGVRSVDGKRFVKTPHARAEFEGTEAYSELFMSLVTNAESAADFINGIMPAGMEQDVAKLQAQYEARQPATPDMSKIIPYAEAEEMDRDALIAKLADGFTVGSR